MITDPDRIRAGIEQLLAQMKAWHDSIGNPPIPTPPPEDPDSPWLSGPPISMRPGLTPTHPPASPQHPASEGS